MRIIDRYILRQYFKILLICLFSMSGLFIVIDAFANLDELLRIAEEQGSLAGLLLEYYGARTLMFFDRTSGLMTLVSAAFVATGLQRSNELAALMGAGIPRARVVAPLIGGAALVACLAAANREILIPAFRDNLMRNAQDWDGQAERKFDPRYDNRTDVLINGSHTLAADQSIGQPNFRRQPGMGGFGNQLLAEVAYYRPAEADRPAGYLLDGVRQPEELTEIASFHLDEQPVVLSPRDTPWLEPDQCFVVSDISFEQLAAGNAWRQYSSTSELIAGLHNPSLDFPADVRVSVHARLLQPVLDMTLLFLGLPMVLSRDSRNVFVSAGLCVLVVAAFVLVVLACHAAGFNYLLSPALAAWCPVLIFVPVARYTAGALWR
jgi:lipopolysaccharide export system permease protein